MTANDTFEIPLSPDANRQVKSAHRRMWALGDYHRFATSTVWQLGPVLVDACGISAGQRVLDVAAGTGNVAIRAAKAGATVVASDLTPANFEAGRRAAAAEASTSNGAKPARKRCPSTTRSSTSSRHALGRCSRRTTAPSPMSFCASVTIDMVNFTPDGAAGDFFYVSWALRAAAAAGCTSSSPLGA